MELIPVYLADEELFQEDPQTEINRDEDLARIATGSDYARI